MFRECYRRLGLAPGSGPAEIKAAYRHLAKRTHPDLGGPSSAASDEFAEVHQAYRTLMAAWGPGQTPVRTMVRVDHRPGDGGRPRVSAPAYRLRAVRRDGPDLVYEIELSGRPARLDLPHQGQSACPDCEPKTRADCPRCFGLGRVPRFHLLGVDLPAGAAPGESIRLPGRGEVGPGGYGDLIVELVSPSAAQRAAS